ncbi:hypothetical protein AB0J80_23270 [Actinoplanes sp. NPDC049548]|uniref:LppU/SCO3897 family protein n=1 Tax=Actinoplanes sp. NPDC049548 TaxID=3155152 RepID=UPI003449231F
MSQNGPYPGQGWPNGGPPGSDEPYTEPADPWGDAATAASPAPESAWGGQPMSVPPTGSSYTPPPYPAAPLNNPPPWQQPPMPVPPKRRNTPIVVLVVVLTLLICGGLGTTALLVSKQSSTKDRSGGPTVPATTATNQVAAPEPQTSEDARFVKKGQCVRNQGNADDSPDLKIVVCTTGTFQVLKRVDGRTSGEADAEDKCSKVPKYTKWYFYDSELDSLDFVLCLKEYGAD